MIRISGVIGSGVVGMVQRACVFALVLIGSTAFFGATAKADVAHSFIFEGDQVVPPSGSIAAGQGRATLNTAETSLVFAVVHGVTDATAATVHAADVGSNGSSVLFTLTQVNDTTFNGTWAIDSNGVEQLNAGRLYVQIESSLFPNGEVRGQIALNPDPKPGDVIITEIMYDPLSPEGNFPNPPFAANPEWIELFNTTFTDIEIGGWFFQDEDVEDAAPCTPLQSGSFPSFVLRSFQTVVVIPDGAELNGEIPTVADFKTSWNLGPEINVIQLNADGTTGGAIVGRNLSNSPVNDGFANDLPLVPDPPVWIPCGIFEQTDNEILTINDGTQIIDVVNYGDEFDDTVGAMDWPAPPPGASIQLVPADYPAIPTQDVSSFTAAGNDNPLNWIGHNIGDLAGGKKQSVAAGVYHGNDIGSPGFLYGASTGNQPPVSVGEQLLLGPGGVTEVVMDGTDNTRPFFGLLLYLVKTLPQNGSLYAVAASNHLITPADVSGNGYLMPMIPFDLVRYENNGTCGMDSFTFSTFDGILESDPVTVEFFVQCGDVVITEIMYNPDSVENNPSEAEWVEIYNNTDSPIDLAGWYLADDVTRSGDFPSYILGARSAVVAIPFVADEAEYAEAWGSQYLHITSNGDTGNGGIAGSNLSNGGESLRIVKPGGATALVTDAVFFKSGFVDPQWPRLSPDGPSIYMLPSGPYEALANDDPFAWDKSINGSDGAALVELTTLYNGDDIGSPGYLHGIFQGPCFPFGFSFDGNRDFVVDVKDYEHFDLCSFGPDQSTPLNCDCFDSDDDGDLDLIDFASFQANFD
ncbi:MAG TPA: lamin tail domain-containing protein [Phycisphaerae bacterium]|nr:lamin tail domain-containing protein [Phycisphaerae bacterium]